MRMPMHYDDISITDKRNTSNRIRYNMMYLIITMIMMMMMMMMMNDYIQYDCDMMFTIFFLLNVSLFNIDNARTYKTISKVYS